MKLLLRNELVRVMLALVLLLALKAIHTAGWPQGEAGALRDRLVTTLTNRGLNKEAREALTAGYYEGLLNEGSRLGSMNRFVLDNRRPVWEDNSRPESRPTGDYLFFEHVPNAATPDYTDKRFKYVLRTNSAGLGDREYALAKPAGVWRVALMGDSITRGLGAPPGGNYESLLEDRLNGAQAAGGAARVEILNFAVSGYHITQQLEAARVKAAAYHPDAYVIALSDLSVYRRWHGHISSLMYSGIDLKYDYLKDMIRETRLTPDDPIGVFDARLARYRLPTIGWVLREFKSLAASQGAELMAILVPTTENPQALAEAFLGVRDLLEDEGIPYVDLLDTFAAPDADLKYRIAEGDRHPNAAGHRLLFDRLYADLQRHPELMQIVSGSGAAAENN